MANNFTYSGPSVSAAFTVGVFNDAWSKATERGDTAMAARNLLLSGPIAVDSDAMTTTDALAGTYSVPSSPGLSSDTDSLKAAFKAQLEAMLAKFVSDHYPAYTLPDAAAAWDRVADSFDGGQIEPVIDAANSRSGAFWLARGVTIPNLASEYGQRYLDQAETDIRVNAGTNKEIIRKAHRQDIVLARFEMVMNSQLEALNAARAFLLGVILPIQAKVDEDQLRFMRLQTSLQSAHWRYLDALITSGSTEMERLILNRRIKVDAALAGQARKEFVFRELAQAVSAEVRSIGSQATAAIGQIHGGSGIGASEQL